MSKTAISPGSNSVFEKEHSFKYLKMLGMFKLVTLPSGFKNKPQSLRVQSIKNIAGNLFSTRSSFLSARNLCTISDHKFMH